MSSDSEVVKIKALKPPPPVPPRPSKTLIKEALAKTRQAHAIYVTSKNPDNPPPPATIRHHQPLQEPNTNNEHTLSSSKHNGTCDDKSHSVIYENHVQSQNCNARPVVYQSKNCRAPPVPPSNDLDNKSSVLNTNNADDFVTKNARVVPIRRHSSKKLEGGMISANTDLRKEKFSVTSNGIDTGNKIVREEDHFSITSIKDSIGDKNDTLDRNSEDMLNNRNYVNTLIDEMFASVLEVNLSNSASPGSSTESIDKDSDKITISHPNIEDSNDDNLTVIVIGEGNQDKSSETKDSTATLERKVKFNDLQNHEFLINELQNMKSQEDKILKRQRMSPIAPDEGESLIFIDSDRIQTSDWYGVNKGKKVKMSSCNIKIDDPSLDDERTNNNLEYIKMKNMSRAYGLPPLPKSLSAFMEAPDKNYSVKNNNRAVLGFPDPEETNQEEKPNKEMSNLERQLAILRREMDGLREQDLSLLSKLWFLNESIQDFRQMLQEQEEKSHLILSPSPTPSSIEDDEFYVTSTC